MTLAPITIDWIHIAALLGAVQGVFLAIVLASQRSNRTANRLLAVAVLGFSIHLTSIVYYASGMVYRFPHFLGISYPLPLLYGPLIYLYAVTASDRTRTLRPRDWLHFAPFAAVVVIGLPIYLMSGAEKIAFHNELQRGTVPALVAVADPLKFVSGVAYTVATLLFLRRHSARVKESYSTVEGVSLRWLVHIAAAAAAVWGLATALEVTRVFDHPIASRADDIVAVAIAILVYWIGYRGLRQPEIFDFAAIDDRSLQPSATASNAGPDAGAFSAAATASTAAESTPRYERSGLGEKEAAALERALLDVMEKDRPYLDSGLTLADLAERLDTTPHKLSEVLNTRLGQTFYDFVNAHRVRDVQRRIADQRSRNLKILALAMDAGFASKSTFNHVFRQHTGHTPSAYRRSLTA